LGEWIYEGSLQPADKVRKGSLRWTEASRVPALAAIFDNKQKGIPLAVRTPPVTTSETNITATVSAPVVAPEIHKVTKAAKSNFKTNTKNTAQPVQPSVCKLHPDLPAYVVCTSCEALWC